jgi:hypothetical protein
VSLAAAVVAAPASDEKKPAANDAERLVQQLGSSKHTEREAAAKALDALGAAALPALREGIKSSDAEVRRRAADLLAKLDRQAESAAAIAPTKVRLKATDAPLAEVVRDLVRQTNIRLQLAREPVDLPVRKITIDTGETSFWEALDALCRAAKVSIRPGTIDPSAEDAQTAAINGAIGAVPIAVPNVAGGIVFTTSAMVSAPSEEAIVLQDGPMPNSPTAIIGAARVRLIPDRWANRDRKPGDEMKWTLEILTEPRMRWVNAPSFRFDGKPGLRVDATPQGGNVEAMGPGARRIMTSSTHVFGGPGNVARGVTRHELPVYVKADGASPIGELKGSLAGSVQATTGSVATIADVTKDKTSAVTRDGVKIAVKDYSRADDGTVTLTLELERPGGGPAGMAAGGVMIAGNAAVGRVIRNGGGGAIPANVKQMISGPDGPVESIKLTDEKGKQFDVSVTKSEFSNNNGTMTAKLGLECRPPTADSKPKALEIHGPRSAAVEAAFTLKDVPAP